MAGGGFIIDMVNTIKNNARPRRDYYSRFKEKAKYRKREKAKIAPEKLASVKSAIRLKMQKENQRQAKIQWTIAAIFLILFILFIYFLTQHEVNFELHDLYNKIFRK